MSCRLAGAKPLSENQCWNIVNWTLRNKLQWNVNKNFNIFIEENTFESVVCEMAAILSRPQCAKVFLFYIEIFTEICSRWSNLYVTIGCNPRILISLPGLLNNCGLLTPHGNIRPGNSLLPDGTKPLPEPMSSHLQHSLPSSFTGSAQGISL